MADLKREAPSSALGTRIQLDLLLKAFCSGFKTKQNKTLKGTCKCRWCSCKENIGLLPARGQQPTSNPFHRCPLFSLVPFMLKMMLVFFHSMDFWLCMHLSPDNGYRRQLNLLSFTCWFLTADQAAGRGTSLLSYLYSLIAQNTDYYLLATF